MSWSSKVSHCDDWFCDSPPPPPPKAKITLNSPLVLILLLNTKFQVKATNLESAELQNFLRQSNSSFTNQHCTQRKKHVPVQVMRESQPFQAFPLSSGSVHMYLVHTAIAQCPQTKREDGRLAIPRPSNEVVRHELLLRQLAELDGAVGPAGEEVAAVVDGHLRHPWGGAHAAEERVPAVLPREGEAQLVGVHGPHLWEKHTRAKTSCKSHSKQAHSSCCTAYR